MIRYYTFLFLFLSATAFSQSSKTVKTTDVYPIRVNHKWGYVKFYPSFVDTIIQPRYDYIGDINLPWNTAKRTVESTSPFRIFEINEKVGLLNVNLHEVLPNKYNRIRPLSPQYFAVEKDSLFVLINKNEDEFFDGEKYNDIKSDWSDSRIRFFFVKKNNKWGIRKLDGPLLVDCKYAVLKRTAIYGYFLAKNKPNDYDWTLIDHTGKKVLSKTYKDIQMVDANIIAVKYYKNAFFSIYRKQATQKGYVHEGGKYKTVEKVNEDLLIIHPHHFSVSSADTIELWNLPNMKKIRNYGVRDLGNSKKSKITPWFYPLDDKYAIIKKQTFDRSSIEQFLVDSSGVIVSLAFDSIFCTAKEGVYFAGKKYTNWSNEYWRWGLIAPGKDQNCRLPPIYNEILDFENDIAIIRQGNSYGAIAVRGDSGVILEALYSNLFISDKNTLQVQTMNELTVTYKLTDDIKFVEDALYEKMMVFSKNIEPQLHEAEPNSMSEMGDESAGSFKRKWSEFSFNYTSDELCLYNRDTIIKNTKIKEIASRLIEILPGTFAFYHENKNIETPFTKTFFGGSVAQISFYDYEKNELISKFKLIGFRPFKKGYKYTTFLAPDGKMGLMDRNGNQLMADGQPVRYLFIGPFYADRARICVGNRLVIDKKDNLDIPGQYMIYTKQRFGIKFHVEINNLSYRDPERFKGIYALQDIGSPKWSYIDNTGKVILAPDADFVLDFNGITKIAKVLKRNNRENRIKPDADVGLIDTKGKVILDVNYNDIREYSRFHQIAVDSTPTFYFTKKGHQLFINRTKLRSFSGGLALFSNEKNQWGYVDTVGHIAISPQYSIARPFSDGVAMVVDSTGYCSYIDTKGTLLFRSDFTAKQWRGIGDFHEGKVWFKRKKGWFWGCYNKKGEEVISPKFYYKVKGVGGTDHTKPYHLPMDFSKDAAAVLIINTDGKPFASIIDTIGTKIIEDKNFKNIGPFDKYGLASYTFKDAQGIGIINSHGKKLTEPIYTKLKAFENGYAKVLGKNKKWGLIDVKGNQLLPCSYIIIGDVSEGLVSVKAAHNKGWFFVALNNKIKIKGPFNSVNPFKGGVTLVKYKNKDLFINKKGEQIYIKTGKPSFFSEGILGITKREPINGKGGVYFYADESGSNIFGRYFAQISAFQLGVAQVRRIPLVKKGQKRKREFFGAINKRGVMVVPPKFRNLHLQPDGNIVINPQLFFGIANREGKVLLEPIYDRIQLFSNDDIIRVEQGEKIGYVFLKEDGIEWIWNLQN